MYRFLLLVKLLICFILSLKGTDELCMCMEFMDASVARFYRTMHSLDPVPFDKLNTFLRRVAHDVSLL